MLLSLCELPLWASTVLLVLLPTAVAMCGPVLVRRQVDLARLTTNNEIAGFKFATVGVIYAVLLAFAVIAVWEKFSEAEEMVTKEAGAAATLYRLAAGSEPEAAGAKAALNNYLRLAIDRDWPAMAKEKESRDVTRALDGLYAAILRLPETEVRKSAALAEMLKQLDEMTEVSAHKAAPRDRHRPDDVMGGSVLRRGDDDWIHFLFRHQKSWGSNHHDGHTRRHRVHGPPRDRIIRSSLHRSRPCRRGASPNSAG